MDHVQQLAGEHFDLHLAAVAGDDEGVHQALAAHANVNALDSLGRTALMCAVAGDEWETVDASDASFMSAKRLNTIRILLGHPDISLLTLNLPHSSMNGVIPLGMAAWLNMPLAVRVLLEESSNCVSVDGMDSHGATALMYAARDGNLEVVRLLLSHGARPDFRDRNHRTSIQFSLAHPRILWLCEAVLRRHRWRESESAERSKLSADTYDLRQLMSTAMPSVDYHDPPPPTVFTNEALTRLTKTIISSITSSDLPFLYSLLFSPPLPPFSPPALYPMSAPLLVNRPDPDGWSPIHHCVAMERPSVKILDALYCAGADIALFTSEEHFTPLHVLAQTGIRSEAPEQALAMYEFVVHLIHDLHAPLSARDKDDETCIHIAAERGCSLEVLSVFLEFDTSGSVREIRNSRGLTALEVAKPEFRVAFGEDAEGLRPKSSLSSLTIRPTDSFTSLASFSDWGATLNSPPTRADLILPSDFDVIATSHQLLVNLRSSSPSIPHPADLAHIQLLERVLEESSHLGQLVIDHFRMQVNNAMKELRDLREQSKIIEDLHDTVCLTVSQKLVARGLEPCHVRKRGSEDSEFTRVSCATSAATSIRVKSISTPHLAEFQMVDETHASIGTQTMFLDFFDVKDLTECDASATQWPRWFDSFIRQAQSPAHKVLLGNLLDVEREITQCEKKLAGSSTTGPDPNVLSKDPKYKQLLKKKKRVEEKILKEMVLESPKKDQSASSSTATSKFKAWIKRKITNSDRPQKLEILYDIDENDPNVGREVKTIDGVVPQPQPIPIPIVVIHSDRFDPAIDNALRNSRTIIEAAQRDFNNIAQSLISVEELLTAAEHSLTRSERVLKRASKKRELMLSGLRVSLRQSPALDDLFVERRRRLHVNVDAGPDVKDASIQTGSPGLLGYSVHLSKLSVSTLTSRPSISSLASISSGISVAATLTENQNDDDETKALRRLLLRKLEAGIGGAWEEMDKVVHWLKIVKEAVRGVKRRTYL
ncbi:ankyrin [Pluteus cervinus]|uniref:Ankyrin n=1 Tax=Pluteus cervinus TaxID=181527 RepID=A0ACD3A8W0_9AGAR|nr:ankyrin [Pluteus cervinus]